VRSSTRGARAGVYKVWCTCLRRVLSAEQYTRRTGGSLQSVVHLPEEGVERGAVHAAHGREFTKCGALA
jgi:hypothetical protein